VYGSSEGLRTVTIDALATGGQAAASSLIENYLGFPAGLSGDELAERAELQARKFGATILVPGEATAISFEEHGAVVKLADGERFTARSVVVASGARYRKLDVPRLEELEGNGVYYAATLMELPLCLDRNVVVVGGGNSAGQATVFFSEYAAHVWLLARENDLGENMSRYLVDRIERSKRVDVLLHTEARELIGADELAGVVVEDTLTGERRTLETSALFVFIGAYPCTGWLSGVLELDRSGYVLTGHDLGGVPATGVRDPFLLETSRPGVFAAGDVRSGSVKRVAAAVGEGAMAVQFVHRYLAAPGI
jgi:thioredoxin reductase (NADPH)